MEQYPLLTPVMGEPERTNSENELLQAFEEHGNGPLSIDDDDDPVNDPVYDSVNDPVYDSVNDAVNNN